ncbi:hypothetical protein ACFSSA_00460 [Luteolibacter algae]|uniref:Uncharacterized protein n=1 Tax=Luteolibacter algae TaxID=454151 RepID=A0ABW5D590_9BACT
MKTTSHPAALKVVTLASCALAAWSPLAIAGNGNGNNGNGNGNSSSNGNSSNSSDSANTNTIPAIPVGWLTAFPTVVQTGTKPTLSWSITYPSIVKDYVDIIPPATVDPKEELDVEVRVLGNGVTVSSGYSYNFVNAEAQLSFNGGNYQRIFYGTNYHVNPNTVVWSKKKVQPHQTLRFGGRYYYNGWGTTYTSSKGTQNVRTLVNGDIPPTKVPMYSAPSLEDFIKPYLDKEGRVKIGPMDVIVFMELTHSDYQQYDQGYDLQDMVLLVTFTSNQPKNNNGHGNNVDGIDSSNPGKANFMEYDTDPNVDDER